MTASLFEPADEPDEATNDDEPEAADAPEPAPTIGELGERDFLLSAGRTFDAWLAAWAASGRDPEVGELELRGVLRQALVEAQKARG